MVLWQSQVGYEPQSVCNKAIATHPSPRGHFQSIENPEN
jgi:hypothetical protein